MVRGLANQAKFMNQFMGLLDWQNNKYYIKQYFRCSFFNDPNI